MSSGRAFHNFDRWPDADLKDGIFNRLLFLVAKECTSDLFLNFLHKYGGAKLLTPSKAITVSLYRTASESVVNLAPAILARNARAFLCQL